MAGGIRPRADPTLRGLRQPQPQRLWQWQNVAEVPLLMLALILTGTPQLWMLERAALRESPLLLTWVQGLSPIARYHHHPYPPFLPPTHTPTQIM